MFIEYYSLRFYIPQIYQTLVVQVLYQYISSAMDKYRLPANLRESDHNRIQYSEIAPGMYGNR